MANSNSQSDQTKYNREPVLEYHTLQHPAPAPTNGADMLVLTRRERNLIRRIRSLRGIAEITVHVEEGEPVDISMIEIRRELL